MKLRQVDVSDICDCRTLYPRNIDCSLFFITCEQPMMQEIELRSVVIFRARKEPTGHIILVKARFIDAPSIQIE